ncbi:hypothetical protein [Pseudomonas sp. Irchel 3E13]|uniref:hypothetical protein n=1 Tax=Pseudomonas sp. Irchel 3E13 TaxID=2008975 RepID=UPI000BA3A4F0|nr:hypothetical protein [Pseudomonas sp. Irchel 3E13]
MTRVDISAWGAEPPLFVRLLAAEAVATDRTRASKRIGMSRTTVSLILANKYSSPSTASVERRVMEVLGRIECVAVGETLTVEQCQGFYQRSAPTHNPMAMQHWRACQQCPLNPNCGGNGNAAVH